VEKTALELLEDVSETLTDFVIDETVPQEHRDRVAPSVAAIDEFFADSILEADDYYEDDEDYDEDEYDDEDSFEDDESIERKAA